MKQPIWGSEYLKMQHTCIYIRGWIEAGILYITDLVNKSGHLQNLQRIFYFKLLQNIVPRVKIICKWQKNMSKACEHCSEIETARHMLYECPRVHVEC